MTQPIEPGSQQTGQASGIPSSPADPELSTLQSEMLQLQANGESGASWFYWIAGLSFANSVIAFFGGNVAFVVGLAITELAEEFVWSRAGAHPELASAAKFIALGSSLVIALVVVGFGWLSNKRIIPIFALGILLYALDGMLYVLSEQWLCVAFHAFALFNMWQGLIAYRRLSAILQSSPAVT